MQQEVGQNAVAQLWPRPLGRAVVGPLYVEGKKWDHRDVFARPGPAKELAPWRWQNAAQAHAREQDKQNVMCFHLGEPASYGQHRPVHYSTSAHAKDRLVPATVRQHIRLPTFASASNANEL
ncbi:nuclease [Anopheles sinensis]|uniref:Nuclease n=1 Tax=Anopheles sinensis TaxID=74873 RepID=A0A084WCW6_ANOSI|nr:nuclease [Anopheles sinensis]